MPDILITIEKEADFSGNVRRWSNSYLARVGSGNLDDADTRQLALNLVMFENHLHLPFVSFKRVSLRAIPYQTATAGTFRVFMPEGRANGQRVPNIAGDVLPFQFVFTVKKQTGRGRSGHLAYHGVLTSCDVSVNTNERWVLRGDSDLCGQRMTEARYIMLNEESKLLVPGVTADYQLAGPQRFVNFLSQGSVTLLHGLDVRQRHSKPTCVEFRDQADTLFSTVADAMMALQDPPENIVDEIYVDPIRWTFDAIGAAESGAKQLREKLVNIGSPPYGIDETEKCHFAAKTLDKISALQIAEAKAKIWVDPNSAGTSFLKMPGPTRPKSDLDDVLAEARPVVAALDEFRSAVAFFPEDTLMPRDPLTGPVLGWLTGAQFEPCDAATAAYLLSRMR